jgi:hypothetical protein
MSRKGLSKLAFVPFLSEDNDTHWDLTTNTGGGSEYGRAVTKLLNTNLRTLLEADDTTFFSAFNTNGSLVKFLDTFLRFRARTIDGLWSAATSDNEAAAVRSTMSDARKEKSLDNLDRRVLTTYFRLIVNHSTDNTLSELLSKRHVIDVPKLLDLCVLYGRKYPSQVRTVIQGVIKIQPSHLTGLQQAWAYTVKAMGKSLDVLRNDMAAKGTNSSSNSNSNSNSSSSSSSSSKKRSGSKQDPRARVRDVLRYILDMLDTTVSVVVTVPRIFRETCSDRTSDLLVAVALCSGEGLQHAAAVLEQLPGGVHAIENNAFRVIRSLSLRLAHEILNHCFFGPLETGYRSAGVAGVGEGLGRGNGSESGEEGREATFEQGETKSTSDGAAASTSKNTQTSTSALLWSVLNDLCQKDDMEHLRTLLQIHHNVAGRVQRLIDARVLDHDAFSGLCTQIFADAPIPVSIMEEELEQESEIDVVLRESKNREDARSKKMSFNAKRRHKKGILHDEDWMRDDDDKRNNVDVKLREAMRAIMRKYDEDDDVDDTLDSMTSSLRLRSDFSVYSDDDDDGDYDDNDGYSSNSSSREDEDTKVELLEVTEVNGVSTGVVRDADGKKVEVLMPNMNRQVSIPASSRGRGRKRRGGGSGSHVDTRKCFNCGQSGHLSNECPKPRMTGSEKGKLKKAQKEKAKEGKKNKNQSKGVKGGGKGNAAGTKSSNERQRKRNEKNKSSRANHNRKTSALKKSQKGM